MKSTQVHTSAKGMTALLTDHPRIMAGKHWYDVSAMPHPKQASHAQLCALVTHYKGKHSA